MSHHENQGSFKSFVLGFLLGAGFATTAALLKAPQSGEETRRQLQRTAKEMQREADSVVSTAKAHLQEAKDELAQHAAEIKAESEAAVRETKKVLTEGAKDVQQEAQESAADVHQTMQST
jgi:gas vesicle protein